MNFKNISIIIALLYLDSKVLASPIQEAITELEISNDELSFHEISGDEMALEVEEDSDSMEAVSGDEVVLKVEEDSDVESASAIVDNQKCLTPECYEASKHILSRMDLTADPCDNFYQYTCGGWMNENEIPDDESYIYILDEITNKTNVALRGILEGDYPVNENLSEQDQKLDRETFDKLKNLYTTCMNMDALDAKGKEPLINLIRQFDMDKTKYDYKKAEDLTHLLVDLHDYQVNALFTLETVVNPENNESRAMGILQSDLLLDQSFYENPDYMAMYGEILQTILTLVLGDQPNHDVETMTYQIINFERNLAKLIVPMGQFQNVSDYFNKSTIDTFNKRYPNINWELYFQKRFEAAGVEKIITGDTVIIDATPSYLEGLNKLLGETDADTLIAYAEWNIIQNYIDFISDDASLVYTQFTNVIYGLTDVPPRSETCIKLVQHSMPLALGKFYVEKNFDETKKEYVKEVIGFIKEAMAQRIPKMEWLDEKTKDAALQKVSTMYEVIGYPDNIMNPEYLHKTYGSFVVEGDDFFSTMMNQYHWAVHEKIRNIEIPVTDQEWDVGTYEVNAEYNPSFNSINVSAGILQAPYFDTAYPDYLNYGGIGSVLGHELTHAFDKDGKDYDANGKTVNWWSDASLSKFDESSQCFVEQFNNYYIEDENGEKYYVDGELTLNENLADNGGVARAYEAWKLSQIHHPESFEKRNPTLPGLEEFTLDQLFYIAYGQFWCMKARLEFTANFILKKDPHSPNEFRCNGTLSNSAHFAETFHCPSQTPMNPEKKCSIW